jgi:hypothetical protein
MTVRIRSCHQPERPQSWRRRAPTARLGTKKASERIPERAWPASYPSLTVPAMLAAQLSRRRKSWNHQNSALPARPEKVPYLERQAAIDSLKLSGNLPRVHRIESLA